MKKHITALPIIIAAMVLYACDFLEPLPNGTYTEENYQDYSVLVRGYVVKAYKNLPTSYAAEDYIGLDACTEDLVYTNSSNEIRQFSIGNMSCGRAMIASIWNRDYEAINYCNWFLKDDTGLNAKYLVDANANARLQRYLQGDAYGLRAWFLFDLVKKFGGRTAEGELLGVPVFTEPVEMSQYEESMGERLPYDECIKQILSDCDSALAYLPEANRDFVVAPDAALIEGAARYRSLDCVSIRALKALVYLTWASPAFNPQHDRSRWEKAAQCAYEVMRYKLDIEGIQRKGFNPASPYYFTTNNDPEVIFTSDWPGHPYEEMFFPQGFGGRAEISPTQEFVDIFGMANGYPIDDPRSGYDPADPYRDRDPRLYSNIFTHGTTLYRSDYEMEKYYMYTFDMSEGGADAPGMSKTSRSGYYIKKFIYTNWNPYDKTVLIANSGIFFLRWTQMCLAFAEAANHAVGPTSDALGMSARDALAYVRSRSTQARKAGVGAKGDPYLDECAAAGEQKFDELVKNEWHVETCLEGNHFFDLRRWGATASELNVPVHGVKVTADGDRVSYAEELLETRSFPSQWLPLPYMEVKKCHKLVQNAGWETWR